jgi:hypothetical protein
MPRGTGVANGVGCDRLEGCLLAYSPVLAELAEMGKDFLKLMPIGTVVLGNGFRRLGDWLESCLVAFGPLLAELVVIVLGLLKLMPKGTDAGDWWLGLGLGSGTRLGLVTVLGPGPELDRCWGLIKELVVDEELGKNIEPWFELSRKGFVPPSLKPLAGLGAIAGCQLVLIRVMIFVSDAVILELLICLVWMWTHQHEAVHFPVEIHRRQMGRFFRAM